MVTHPVHRGNEPDPSHDEHVAFPEDGAARPGTSLPATAWAPAARTTPFRTGSTPTPPSPASAPNPVPHRHRGRRILLTVVVAWWAVGFFSHDHGGFSDGGAGYGSSTVVDGAGPGDTSRVPAALPDGHDPAAFLPLDTLVTTVTANVVEFRVEVVSDDPQLSVTTRTRRSDFPENTVGPWSGYVTPNPGYQAPVTTEGAQAVRGTVGALVSGVVTAEASDGMSKVQCRVYADEKLVLMATGPGSATCRVPASPAAT